MSNFNVDTNGTNTNSSSQFMIDLVPDVLHSVEGEDSQTGVTGQLILTGDTQFGVTLSESHQT